MRIGRPVAWAACALLGGTGARAQVPDSVFTAADGTRFRVEVVARGVVAPSALEFLPDGRLLVAERAVPRLSVVGSPGADPVPVRGLPAMHTAMDAGLHDVVVHPGHAANGWIYLSYSVGDSTASALRVARARLAGDSLVGLEPIFTSAPALDTAYHYGGSMALAGGFLYLTVGDHHYRHGAQDLASLNGKVVRLREDGTVPGDNPFADRPGARPEIWSLGHRNPQGIAVHPVTGALWISEHGPLGGDEINVVRRGADYGWPTVTHGTEYDGTLVGVGLSAGPGLEPPFHVMPARTAPSGLLVYDGEAFPAWRGNVFLGSMGSGRHLRRVVVEDGRVVSEDPLLASLGWRVRSVAQGPEGYLYVGTDYGLVLRLVPAGGEAGPTGTDAPAEGSAGTPVGSGTRELVLGGGLTVRVLLEAANLGRDDVEVAEITFPAGPRPRTGHRHGSLEILYVLEGKLGHVVNGVEHRLGPGATGVVQPGDEVIHAVLSEGPVRALVIWVPGGEADRIAPPERWRRLHGG